MAPHQYLNWKEAIVIEVILVFLIGMCACYYIYRTNEKGVTIKSYVSAHKAHGWHIITISLLATYIGNWTLFTPADFGALFSIVGIVSYAISAIIPVIIIGIIGPHIANKLADTGFTSIDFFKARYGNLTHSILLIFSMLYMWIALVAELTTIERTFGIITNFDISSFWAIIPVSIGTLAYTIYAGLPVSIFTDRFQTVLVSITGIIILFATFFANPIGTDFFPTLNIAPDGSWIAGIVLIITVYPSEVLNQSAWQRILSCKTDRDIRLTCLITSAILFMVILFFGFLGVISNYLDSTTSLQGAVIFTLVSRLPVWILVMILIFSIALVTSTIDSAQNAMIALLGSYLEKNNLSITWARLITVLFNIPAIVVASLGLNIFNLFYTANLLCLSVVAPQLLALHPYFTQYGAIAGFISGFISIFVVGWIDTRDFIRGLTFFYPSDIANISYIIIGIITPIVSSIFTFLGSWVEKRYFSKHKRSTQVITTI